MVREQNNDCVICGTDYKKNPAPNGWDGGHNAVPVADGRCCYDCDEPLVTPARLANVLNYNYRQRRLRGQRN